MESLKSVNYYSCGMVEYINNNLGVLTKEEHLDRIWTELHNEYIEFSISFKHKDYLGSIAEIFDIWHILIRWIITYLLPRQYLSFIFLWYIAFFLGGVITPYKLAQRYRNLGCIRSSRHCTLKNHVCSAHLKFE
jgi:hypothetical protein